MNFEGKKKKIQNESFTEITFTEIRVPKRTFTEISEISTEIHLRVPKSEPKVDPFSHSCVGICRRLAQGALTREWF